MPSPARPCVLACRPATVAIVPRRQIAVAALGRLTSGLRRSHSPSGAQARQRPSTPEQKTGTLMLFPALDCRKHLASTVRLVTIDTGGERFGFFLPSIDVPEGQRRISTRLASTGCQRTKLDPASAVDLAVHRTGWNGADRDSGIIVYGL